jgi:hypothetical protein
MATGGGIAALDQPVGDHGIEVAADAGGAHPEAIRQLGRRLGPDLEQQARDPVPGTALRRPVRGTSQSRVALRLSCFHNVYVT